MNNLINYFDGIYSLKRHGLYNVEGMKIMDIKHLDLWFILQNDIYGQSSILCNELINSEIVKVMKYIFVDNYTHLMFIKNVKIINVKSSNLCKYNSSYYNE